MSQADTRDASPTEKKDAAGVTFSGTSGGKLDESEIPSDDYKSHYLFSGGSKSDSSYPVVDADDTLRKGNVKSAHELGARGGVSAGELESKLKTLNSEFDDPPIDFDESDENAKAHRTGGAFARSVAFERADEEQQIAYGAVLVPDRVDHMGDFFRPETVAALAENFEDRVADRDAVPGVMHSVFPSDVELAENRLTDAPQSLGERDLPAGSWVQGWKFTDDELWSLVKDGVLGGYSIGGTIDPESAIRYGSDAHPDDVEFPPEVESAIEDAGLDPSEVSIREVTDGRILEVSAVDHPAVPDATHESYKSRAPVAKSNPALTQDVVAARLYLEDRGHDPADAKRLAEYLQTEKSREPSGWIGRAKRFFTDSGDRDGGGSVASDDTDAQSDAEPAETRRDADADANRDSLNMDLNDDQEAALKQLIESEIDGDGEGGDTTDEQTGDSTDKSDDTDTDGEADANDALVEAIETLGEQQSAITERLDALASAQGVSQQVDRSTGDGDTETWSDGNSPFATPAAKARARGGEN